MLHDLFFNSTGFPIIIEYFNRTSVEVDAEDNVDTLKVRVNLETDLLVRGWVREPALSWIVYYQACSSLLSWEIS